MSSSLALVGYRGVIRETEDGSLLNHRFPVILQTVDIHSKTVAKFILSCCIFYFTALGGILFLSFPVCFCEGGQCSNVHRERNVVFC